MTKRYGIVEALMAAIVVTVAAAQFRESRAQGVPTHATNGSSAAQDQVAVLRQQLVALAGRVRELEKKAEQANNISDADPHSRNIEQRLTAVEHGQQKLETAQKQDHGPENPGAASHVQAPFVVYDDAGHAIFRVEIGVRSKAPRVIVGNELGAHAVIGASDEQKASALLLSGEAGSDVAVEIIGGASSHLKVASSKDKRNTVITASSLKVSSQSSNLQALLGLSGGGDFGLFVSRGDIGSVTLSAAGSGAGYLSLSNAKNEIVAEGGSKPNGVGIFRTGPSCCKPPGAVGPHQYIVGRNE
jgi:hypothetical protein